MENPCRDCVAPKRHTGCHGSCKEHKKWLFLHHIEWKEEYQDRLVTIQMYEMSMERGNKKLRRKPEPLRHGRKVVNQ